MILSMIFLFYYMSSLSLYALQLDQNASQGAGVKALYQSMFLPAPEIVGQNLSRKVRASLDQIRDRSFALYPARLTAHIPTLPN